MTKKLSKKKAKLKLDQHSNIVDSLLNYETIKYYCAEEYELERFKEAKFKTLALSSRKCFYRLTTGVLSESILNIGFFFGTLLLVDKIARGADGATPGDYMLYGIYVKNLKEPIESFAYRYDLILENITNVHMLLQLLAEKTENNSIENPIEMGPSSDAIEFKNVSFEYLPGMLVLRDLSFRIEAGKTLALVGESGSGKSTIIRLLFRLIEPSKGQILFGGSNIQQIPLRDFRQAIGVVPQETTLFNDTIGYNIRYGRRDASDEEVEKAAEAAKIHEFIQSRPDGYESKVGNRGLKLSGGEKQRVAIARTILKDPAYILLDEATSSLDSKTELAIKQQLDEICQDRTCVIVAHRLSTVMNADHILVLQKGQIVENGSHAELMNKNGVYSEMWKMQMRLRK